MKKVLMLLAVAGMFFACNAPTEKKTEAVVEESATEQVVEAAQDTVAVEEVPAVE